MSNCVEFYYQKEYRRDTKLCGWTEVFDWADQWSGTAAFTGSGAEYVCGKNTGCILYE